MITSAMLARQISPRSLLKSPNSFIPTLVPPLDLSSPSFRRRARLKSITYSLLWQNTGGTAGAMPTTNLADRVFSTTYKSLLEHPRFISPLFSWSYKTLFAQPLSLQIDTKPPSVTPMISANLIATRDGHRHFASRIRRPAANPGQRADSSAHRTAARLARIAPRRSLGIPRTPLFFRDARHQNSLQANCYRRFVGGAAAAYDHGRFHDFFRPPRQTSFAGPALSSFLFCGAGALGLFFAGAYQLHQHCGGQPERDHQSVFSALDFAGGGRVFGFGGFRDWSGSDGGVDAFL